MIPNIFVSSTIMDFQHLRDAIRDTITELGYNPVMSEYGDIGYLPSISAEDSCYLTMRECNIAIILIGKRYGSLSKNEFSITQNEFRAARKDNLPVICLVDREVLSFKQIYDANIGKKKVPLFPGMDNPEKTFEFINEFINSPVNNGFLDFSNVSEVRLHLKRQFAHLFGDLIRNRFEPLKSGIHDVLSEIKTLRLELLKDQEDYQPLLATFRFLLSDMNENIKSLLEMMFGNIDEAVPYLVKAENFKEFITITGWKVEVKKEEEMKNLTIENKLQCLTVAKVDEFKDFLMKKENYLIKYGMQDDKVLVLDNKTNIFFTLKFKLYRTYLKNKLKNNINSKILS